MEYHVYILRCNDGSYYVGVTNDLEARLALHNSGQGPKFTALRRPVELVYAEPCDTLAAARRREIQVKKWTRVKKEALIASRPATLKRLSRCRGLHGRP